MKDYDFSCWVIRYDRVSISGLTYTWNCLSKDDGKIVPLIQNHEHYNPSSVLGYAELEHREDGVYAYCKLNDIPTKESIMQMIADRGLLSLSPFVKQVRIDGKNILHGSIAEVSLVLARMDPDELYYPVMKTND